MKSFTFLPILAILFTVACTPEPDPIDEPPKAKGIYECLIDGEEFRANGPNFANQWSPNPHASYTEVNGNLRFLISNHDENQMLDLKIAESIMNEGQFKIANQTKFADLDIIECDSNHRYELVKDKDYFVEITHLDTEHDIIVGSFEFDLVNECRSDTISVNGSFDLEYSL